MINIILIPLLVYFALEIISVNPSKKWYIVTDCSQEQELRKKKNLLFHQDVRVFSNDILSYCGTVEQVEFAGWDCYFMEGAFEGCANLGHIKLPSKLEKIPDNMFRNCKSLKQITIPATVKSIGKNAFEGCNGLTSVVFEDPTGWHVTKNPTNAKNKTGGGKFALPLADPVVNVKLVKDTHGWYWYKVD